VGTEWAVQHCCDVAIKAVSPNFSPRHNLSGSLAYKASVPLLWPAPMERIGDTGSRSPGRCSLYFCSFFLLKPGGGAVLQQGRDGGTMD
jgi:hypothetical protein